MSEARAEYAVLDPEFAWEKLAEDMLIAAYVPEADQLDRNEALALALKRDRLAAEELYISAAAPA